MACLQEWELDLMILEVFSNWSDSVILHAEFSSVLTCNNLKQVSQHTWLLSLMLK